jgi:hypothetical protein
MVGETRVIRADAERVRAIQQPPPTIAEAERLAVAATRAYFAAHPDAAAPPVEQRLVVFRHGAGSGDRGVVPVRWNECALRKDDQ